LPLSSETERVFAEGELVSVLTAEPIDRFLDYFAPTGGVELGAYVEVPLGPRKVIGVVWGQGEGSFDRAKIRKISTCKRFMRSDRAILIG